ncbi:MAG: sugar ABC transporter substrate-binding protein [Sulfolobales archaeon]
MVSRVSTIWIAIAVVTLVIGLGAGYALGSVSAPAKVVTEQRTVVEYRTVTSPQMVTVTATAAAPTPTPAKVYTVYYISHGGPGDPWWAPVIKGAQLAGDMLGVKVVYLGPEKFSVKWLVDALQSAVAAKPDGIIITVTDYRALDDPLRRAIAQGIPVIAVNVPDPRPEGERIPYLGYVGQDEYQAGYQLAKYTISWFQKNFGRPPTGAVIGIHEVGHIGLELRAKGIQDAFKEANLPIPEKLDITTDTTKAYEILKSYVTTRRGIEVIFTLGPLGAHPAMQLVRDLNMVGKLFVSTVDLDDKILAGISDGVVIAAVSQQPFAQGFLPVVYMYLYLKFGIKPPAQIPTGPTIIDKSLLDLVRKQIRETGGA